MVLGDRPRELLQQYGLTRFGWGHDQAALALADGGDQIDHSRLDSPALAFEMDPLGGVLGDQALERASLLPQLRVGVVDLLQHRQTRRGSRSPRGDTQAGQLQTGLHPVFLNQIQGDDRIGRFRVVVGLQGAQETMTRLGELQHAADLHGRFACRSRPDQLGRLASLATALAAGAATAPTSAPPLGRLAALIASFPHEGHAS